MGKNVSPMIYEIKAVNPNQIANYDAGKLTKAVGDDLSNFLGEPTQGLVVKASEATKIVGKVKEDLVKKKVKQPHIRAGINGNDMIFVVSDLLGGSYEQSCVLVANYVPLREKLKKQKGMVVNLDKGDKVIDQAAKDMSKKMKTKEVTPDKAKFGLINGSAAIVLLAHGDEDKTDSGQIYGKDFAGKKPEDIAKMLCANPDPKRCLNPDYAGTIYLDGCFTAQGGAMQNYTKQVWELVKKHAPNAKVKGNLGLAATTSEGDEIITTTEADNKAKALEKQADEAWEKKITEFNNKLEDIWQKKYAKKNDEAGYDKDPEKVKIFQDVETFRTNLNNKLQEEQKKIPGYRVKNMIGHFGLQRLN